MDSDQPSKAPSVEAANPFTSADVLAILRERSWLTMDPTPEIEAWCEHAAAILGPHAADRAVLTELLTLVFHYAAQEILNCVETHEVLARYAARDVLRHLALLLLDGVLDRPDREPQRLHQGELKSGSVYRHRFPQDGVYPTSSSPLLIYFQSNSIKSAAPAALFLF